LSGGEFVAQLNQLLPLPLDRQLRLVELVQRGAEQQPRRRVLREQAIEVGGGYHR
jgi:hypothetical protein